MFQTSKLSLNCMQSCFKRTKASIFEIIYQNSDNLIEDSVDNIWSVMRLLARKYVFLDGFPLRITCNCDKKIKFSKFSANCQGIQIMSIHISRGPSMGGRKNYHLTKSLSFRFSTISLNRQCILQSRI